VGSLLTKYIKFEGKLGTSTVDHRTHTHTLSISLSLSLSLSPLCSA
jgi:hypothetical protein